MLALNLRKMKDEALHDFDGFLTVSGPKNSGKQHVIGFVLLRKDFKVNFENFSPILRYSSYSNKCAKCLF